MNRAIEEEDLTQTIALYTNSYGGHNVWYVSEHMEADAEYVRLTEPIKVKFVALSDEVVLKKRVAAVDAEITKTRARLTAKVNDLTDQRNRLLAITHQDDSDD